MNTDTSANYNHSGFSKPEQHRYRSNSYDVSHTKRMRTGSISGRLRTASNLEELGYIDKKQKGLIKDLIISGDTMLQSLLDKYERGDGKELLDLINQGYLGRKESIDLLEGLDFDFLNGFKSDEEGEGGQKHDDFDNFDFSWNDPSAVNAPPPPHHFPNNSHQNSFIHTKNVSSLLVPPPIITNPPHSSAPSLMPPPSSVRSPTGSKISPPPSALTISGQPYAKPRTLSEVAMDFMEKRKESFDAVNISEMIFDDLIGSGTHNHSSGTDTDLGLFEDLLYDPSNPQHRRASRLDSFADAFAHHQFGEFGGDDVDLSAYATLAQSLQNNKNKLPTGNNSLAKDSKLNLKIKLEGNKNGGKPNLLPNSHDATQKSKMNKGILLPTTTISTFGMNNLSMNNANLHNATGFPSSSSVATPAMVNNISTLKTKNDPGNISPSSDLRRTLGFTGSLSTPSTLPGQKPIVTTSGFIGAYTPDQRKMRIERFLEKRTRRVWTRKVKYDVRKNFADSRLRIKGRFVKKEDEDMMRELMSL